MDSIAAQECRTMTVDNIATVLGISRSTAYALTREAERTGEPFRVVRICGTLRIPKKSFANYMERNEI